MLSLGAISVPMCWDSRAAYYTFPSPGLCMAVLSSPAMTARHCTRLVGECRNLLAVLFLLQQFMRCYYDKPYLT